MWLCYVNLVPFIQHSPWFKCHSRAVCLSTLSLTLSSHIFLLLLLSRCLFSTWYPISFFYLSLSFAEMCVHRLVFDGRCSSISGCFLFVVSSYPPLLCSPLFVFYRSLLLYSLARPFAFGYLFVSSSSSPVLSSVCVSFAFRCPSFLSFPLSTSFIPLLTHPRGTEIPELRMP